MRKRILTLLCLLTAPAWTFGQEKTLKESLRHTVTQKDTMWGLAMRYYGTHFKWKRIAEANPAPTVKDPHWIYPGQVLLIPADEPAAAPPPAPEPVLEEPAAPPPAPAPEPPPAPPPAPKEAKYEPEKASEGITLPEALSTQMPEGMTGQGLRVLMPQGWEPDGQVRDSGGQDATSVQGHYVPVSLFREARKHERYTVYRRSAPTEADTDRSATYVHKVGLIEIQRKLAENMYRVLILKSGDTIQPGDLLKKED
jgi:LysM repeat protein